MRGLFVFSAFAASALVLTGFQTQKPIEFDLKDPKGVDGLGISIDAPLEPVRGMAGGVSGNVVIDFSKPSNSTGKVIIDANSVQLVNPKMTEAMHAAWCMDVEKFPTIEFEVTKVNGIKSGKGGMMSARVTGNFTFHGVTKPLTVDASLQYLPGKLKARGGVPKDGDLLQIHSKFSINRLDFAVAKDLSQDVIGNKVSLDLALTGVAIK